MGYGETGAAMSPDYRSPTWLPGSHVQSIYPYLFLRPPPPPYRRERVETPDGDFVDFDQVDGTPGMLAGGKEGAVQPQRQENAEDPTAADVRRRFHRQERAIRTSLLLHPAADRERIGAVAARVAASAER